MVNTFMDFKSFGFSDTGRVRPHNEDSYLCNQEQGLFLVADGMGGHASGETASRLAVRYVEEFVALSRAGAMEVPRAAQDDLTPEQSRLSAAAVYANRRILETAQQDPSLRGMGTTLTGATIDADHLAVMNVGDSRLYLIRGARIEQLTDDHSLVGEQERRGILTREEARTHPRRHILTRAVGVDLPVQVDAYRAEIKPDDLFLLCSDGLYTMLDDEQILSIIRGIEDKSLYKIGLSLVLKANLAGGMDNITVVLFSF